MPMPNPLPEREEASIPREEGHVVPLDSSSAELKPFVLPNRTGGKGGKDKTAKMLLIVIGVVILFVTFFGFISTKGSYKRKSGADEGAKPNLGRVVTPSAPGALIPSDKMAVPSEAAKNGTLDASDIEKPQHLTRAMLQTRRLFGHTACLSRLWLTGRFGMSRCWLVLRAYQLGDASHCGRTTKSVERPRSCERHFRLLQNRH